MWRTDELGYALVSDVDARDLNALAARIPLSSEGPVTARVRARCGSARALAAVLATSTRPSPSRRNGTPPRTTSAIGRFVEALRRAGSGRRRALHGAPRRRLGAIAELQKVQARYGAAGPELRPLLLPS